ncbi:MAG TPA: tetratricopeptide repeat protein [Trichormus sp.]|jgi:hypothetical protein
MKLVTNNAVANVASPPRSNEVLRIEAELRSAVRNARRALGGEHVNTALCLIQLADFLHHEQRDAEAEAIYRHAADVYETLGLAHELLLAIALRGLALTLCAQSRHAEAEAITAKSTALIREFQ